MWISGFHEALRSCDLVCAQEDTVLSCFSHVRVFATPWNVARQALLSMGFSTQEYWSGLPFPSPNFRGYFQLRNQTQVSCIAGRFFTD